jgi:hypothetical protein
MYASYSPVILRRRRVADAASFLLSAARLPAGAGSIRQIMHLRRSIWKESTTAPAAALSPFSTSGPCFIGRPFVCSSLFVCSPAALTGDFALLLTTH